MIGLSSLSLGMPSCNFFAGAILVNKSAALIVNCTESYGRSKTVDAHRERRVGTAMHKSSFPKKATCDGWINTITTHEDNVAKLKNWHNGQQSIGNLKCTHR
ncbi:uncharacterized protein BX663DRAFT_493682 [Cokeromyces recurvatus]|uniref:uncharacterized protein n=1 Tax=Cokeromyces recurvatus TaxID=90255 RepID=UPI00221EC7B9|nr:uncharacterized protein BX663DRAFT_493682 [Cokeromyces recurvatus]KAI7908290.1 hypothetical protein BX663DRAFT_493682 [Cokeromyces recurvatus]